MINPAMASALYPRKKQEQDTPQPYTKQQINSGQMRDLAPKYQPPKQQGRQDLQALMSEYEAAVAQMARRKQNKGLIGASIGLTNPQAGKAFTDSMEGYINQPVNKLNARTHGAEQGLKINKGVSQQYATDQDNDPNSPSSQLARKTAQKYGLLGADNNSATAAQIKRVAPFLSQEMRGTQSFTQRQMVQEKAGERQEDKQVHEKQIQGQKDAAAQQRTDTMAKAGIGKTIISGTFGQEQANNKFSNAQAVAGDSMTRPIPNEMSSIYPGAKFLVRKPGLGADPKAAATINQINDQASRYNAALSILANIIQKIKANSGMAPSIFDSEWPAFISALGNATQKNIKYNGNGVANGPDIEQAAKMIGNSDDLINWLRSGNEQKVAAAQQFLAKDYMVQVDSQGYEPSQNPHQLTGQIGIGGQSGSKQPVNPAATTAANEVATQYGIPAPFGGKTGQSGSARDRLKAKVGVK